MHTPPISRRTVAQGSLWAVPVLTVAAASPALAASGITVPSVTLPVAYVGETVSQPLSAIGGTAPYTWSTTGGQTAPGTALTSSGTVAGTPATAGEFTSTTLAKDTAGSTGTGQLTQVVGANRGDITTTMLSLINARRASIGVAPLSLDTSTTVAQTWAEHLASTGSVLVHQNLQTISPYRAENLSAALCQNMAPTDSATSVGTALTTGWLNEPHSYSEWATLNATNPALAQEMYSGLMPDPANPGKFITSTTYPKASGHRINLENPAYSAVNLGTALSQSGSACTPSTTYGYYGAADFT